MQVINPLGWTQWRKYTLPLIISISLWTPWILGWPCLSWYETRPCQGVQPREILGQEKAGDDEDSVFVILWYSVVQTYYLPSSSAFGGDQNDNEEIHYQWAFEVSLLHTTCFFILYDTFITSFWEILISSYIIKACKYWRNGFLNKLWRSNLLNLISLLP